MDGRIGGPPVIGCQGASGARFDVAVPSRDRVTIDLRGIGDAVRAAAACRGVGVAQLVRRAVVMSLDLRATAAVAAGSDGQTSGQAPTQGTAKLTLRLPQAHADALMLNAGALGLSYGEYARRGRSQAQQEHRRLRDADGSRAGSATHARRAAADRTARHDHGPRADCSARVARADPRPGHEPVATARKGPSPRRRTGSGAGRWNSRLPATPSVSALRAASRVRCAGRCPPLTRRTALSQTPRTGVSPYIAGRAELRMASKDFPKISRDARLEARMSATQKHLLQRAAALSGRTLSDFVVVSALDAARRVIAEHESIHLSREEQLAFVQALLNPTESNERLKRAAKAYRQRTGA